MTMGCKQGSEADVVRVLLPKARESTATLIVTSIGRLNSVAI